MPAGRPERPSLVTGAAILLGSVLVALSIAFTFRWEIAPNSRIASAVLLDRWTGNVVWCFYGDDENPGRLTCGQK